MEVAEAISKTRLMTMSGQGTHGLRGAKDRYSVEVRGGVTGVEGAWDKSGDEEGVIESTSSGSCGRWQRALPG